MAIHKLNKTRTTTWEINKSGDTWVLGENGRIEDTADSPIDFGIGPLDPAVPLENTTVNVFGQIAVHGASASAIAVWGSNSLVHVGESGRVSGYYGIDVENGAGELKIINDGVVKGTYGIWGSAVQDSGEIRNNGSIVADSGIRWYGAGTNIVNDGVIRSSTAILVDNDAADVAPLSADNAIKIVNTGKITGTDHSIEAYQVAVNIRNKGTINGDVKMGDGNDVFNTSGGTLNGMVYGGLGNDVVTLSSPGTVFIEYAGEGYDTVRINSTYMLGENIEYLTLLGKANHTGIGNELPNSLVGNKGANALYGLDGADGLFGGKGNDRLFGGGGDDVFVFKAGAGRDTIMDFSDGDDLIVIQQSVFATFDEFSAAGNVKKVGNDIVLIFSDTDRLIVRDAAVDGTILSNADFIFS